MNFWEENTIKESRLFFEYVCRKIGTEEVIKLRRTFFNIRDDVVEKGVCSYISSGSKAEGLNFKTSDYDVMDVLPCVDVYETEQEADRNKSPYHMSCVMDTSDTLPCYTKIKILNGTLDIPFIEVVGKDMFFSSTLFKLWYISLTVKHYYSHNIHGPCITDSLGSIDYALCLRSRTWFSSARNWITRPRNGDWPSEDLINTVAGLGVLFVPIGIKGSKTECIEWRISFSVAEKLLIHSFNHVQFLCYALLKILLKEIIDIIPSCNNVLCSYHLKTILFWMVEEHPLHWNQERLLNCFMACFQRLIYCIKYQELLHFFIPDCNLLRQKVNGDISELMAQKLGAIFKQGWKCLLFSETLSDYSISREQTFHRCAESDVVTNFSHLFQYFNEYRMYHGSPRDIIHSMRRSGNSKINKYMYIIFLGEISKTCGQEFYLHANNKQTYIQYKNSLSNLLVGLNSDGVSGWLLVATLFYVLKRHTLSLEIISYAISKCTRDKYHYWPTRYLEMRPGDIQEMKNVKNVGFHHILKAKTIGDIFFMKRSLVIPDELKLEVMYTYARIPPVVYSNLLQFLCFHQLKDNHSRQSSLGELIQTIYDLYFVTPDHGIIISYICLGIAFEIIGDVSRSKKCYQRAFNLAPYLIHAAMRLSNMGF